MGPDRSSKSSKKSKAAKQVVDAVPVEAASTTLGSSAVTPSDPNVTSALVVTKASEFAARAMLLKVKDAAAEQEAANLLLQLKSIEKEAKEKLAFLVKPLEDHVKRIKALFKPGFETLAKADSALRQQVISWRQLEFQLAEKTRVEAARKADEAAAKGDNKKALEYATKAVTVATPARVTMASAEVAASVSNMSHAQIASRKRWTFKVVALNKVPREYMELDEVKVRAAIKSGLRNIAGLEIYEEDGLAVGGR